MASKGLLHKNTTWMTIYLHPGLLPTLYTPPAMSCGKAFTSRSGRQYLEAAVEKTCLLLSIRINPTILNS